MDEDSSRERKLSSCAAELMLVREQLAEEKEDRNHSRDLATKQFELAKKQL